MDLTVFYSFSLNEFGLDFQRYGLEWSIDMCLADSDGDGRSNGEELGDPDCSWEKDRAEEKKSGEKVTHPGFPDNNFIPADNMASTPPLLMLDSSKAVVFVLVLGTACALTGSAAQREEKLG